MIISVASTSIRGTWMKSSSRIRKSLKRALIGVPDDYSGERIKAYVVLKEGETATPEEIVDYCKQNLVKYKVPKYVEFVEDLPKSAVGKILRKELRAADQAKAGSS
jgi:long-chain acyl-CoA synthetase